MKRLYAGFLSMGKNLLEEIHSLIQEECRTSDAYPKIRTKRVAKRYVEVTYEVSPITGDIQFKSGSSKHFIIVTSKGKVISSYWVISQDTRRRIKELITNE